MAVAFPLSNAEIQTQASSISCFQALYAMQVLKGTSSSGWARDGNITMIPQTYSGEVLSSH